MSQSCMPHARFMPLARYSGQGRDMAILRNHNDPCPCPKTQGGDVTVLHGRTVQSDPDMEARVVALEAENERLKV